MINDSSSGVIGVSVNTDLRRWVVSGCNFHKCVTEEGGECNIGVTP